MNEQDKAAFKDWLAERQTISANDIWQAACEYKDAQLAAKDAVIAKLREAFISVCCDPDGNVCVGTIGGTYADRGILEEALKEENDNTALQEALKQAKREALLEVADTFEILGGASTAQLRSMAEEIK